MRIVKVVIAGWAIAIGIALIVFLVLLWLAGAAERVWGPLPLSILFAAGLIVACRLLRL
jgi:hypothetical protein